MSISISARPAAADTALPPEVGVVPPKKPLQTASEAMVIAERADAARQALAAGHDLGLQAVVLDREHLAGAAEAGLDLVGDQQDAALLADLVEPVPPLLRRREATDGLDGLGDQRGGVRARVEAAPRRRRGTRSCTWSCGPNLQR